MDSTHIGKNFKYMARTLKDKPPEEYVPSAKAVLRHHFDDHSSCGDWCRRKDETAEQRAANKRKAVYRNLEKDAKLYIILEEKLSRFITHERLVDIAHGMDTNANESFNNTVTWFAPKNRVYCGSRSFNNQISIAIGITSLGFLTYFERLFNVLRIAITKNVRYYFAQRQKLREERLTCVKTKASKKKRNKRTYI